MKIRTLKQTCSSALIVIAALTVAFSFASAQAPETNPCPNEPSKACGGRWLRQLIVKTGDPLGPPFPGLFTFNKGGTMSEYGIGPGFSSPASA